MTLGFAAAGAVVALLLPNQYTAACVLLPPQSSSSAAALLANQLSGSGLGAVSGQLGLKNPNDQYIGMLRSHRVEKAIVKRFQLQQLYRAKTEGDAIRQLDKVANVASTKYGSILVEVTDRDPKRAADMANAFGDELRGLMADMAVGEAGQRRQFFEQQLAKSRDDLGKSEDQFKGLQQQTGMLQVDAQTRAALESTAELQAQIASKQVQIQALRSYAAAENPELRIAEQELAGLRQQLSKVSGAGVSTGRIPELGQRYADSLRDVKYHEMLNEILTRQYEAARLDEARQGSAVQTLDPAEAPDRKSGPKRTLIVLSCALAGCFLSILYALTRMGW